MIRCNTQMRTLKNKQNKTQIDLNDVIVTITTKSDSFDGFGRRFVKFLGVDGDGII